MSISKKRAGFFKSQPQPFETAACLYESKRHKYKVKSSAKIGHSVIRKIDALLIDPHGCFNIVLWANDSDKVGEGGTCDFNNLRLRHNKFNNAVYVNPVNKLF